VTHDLPESSHRSIKTDSSWFALAVYSLVLIVLLAVVFGPGLVRAVLPSDEGPDATFSDAEYQRELEYCFEHAYEGVNCIALTDELVL